MLLWIAGSSDYTLDFITVGSVKNNRGDADRYGPDHAAGNSALSRLSPARHEVLDVLVSQSEPVTAHDVAYALHQHHNTIREHLDGLRRVGLVVRMKGPAIGRGRPPWFYSATQAARDEGSANDYVGLAAALAGQIARTASEPIVEAVDAGRHWGQSLSPIKEAGTSKSSEELVFTLLDDLGYSPEFNSETTPDGDTHLRLRRCPLLAAANENPEIVCGVHRGLIEGALASQGSQQLDVELIPFAERGACALHLRRAESSQA